MTAHFTADFVIYVIGPGVPFEVISKIRSTLRDNDRRLPCVRLVSQHQDECTGRPPPHSLVSYLGLPIHAAALHDL